MLRHACGYALANRGHDTRALQAYLGHKNIQHTVRYILSYRQLDSKTFGGNDQFEPANGDGSADAAMIKLKELFSDPAMTARRSSRCVKSPVTSMS